MLNKKPKTSKFAPKVDEGFLLGYGSNVHAYRVFNKTTSCVENSRDVTFNESNGSQGEQVVNDAVDDEAPRSVIKRMAIGDVRPQETSSIESQPSPSRQNQHNENKELDHASGQDQDVGNHEQASSNDSQRHDEEVDKDGGQESSYPPHPRVHQNVQRDYPVEQILGDNH